MCDELIELKKDYIVTKSEKLLKARYQLNELALKLISIIYSNIRRSDEIGKDYQIKVADISKLMNKNYGEMYNLLKQATNEMLENPLKIEDEEKKEWLMFNWISDAYYKDGVITFTISKRLKPYILDLQQKFLKYKLENILNLRGTYVIRLYEILKDRYNEKYRYSKKTEYTINIRELREMLEIPNSYRFNDIKRQILEKAKQQFSEHTDIIFSYEEIKTGRKVEIIKFIIQENKKNITAKKIDLKEKNQLNVKIESKIQQKEGNKHTSNTPLERLKQRLQNGEITGLRELSFNLQKLQNTEITNALPNARGEILKVNEFGMLELNGEEIDNTKANMIRRILFKHPDLLGKFEEIDEELEELRKKFIHKIWIFIHNNLYYAIGVDEITRVDNKLLKIKGKELLRGIENFEMKISVESLKKSSPKNQLDLIDKDDYIRHNSHIEIEQLEKIFENNKEKFEKWLDKIEKESFEINDKLLELEEGSEEYIKTAKQLEAIDNYLVKGYSLLQGEKLSSIDKKMLFKKFKEWIEKNI